MQQRPLVLRELDSFASNKHFDCLAILFLMQWHIVGEDLGPPWDQWDHPLGFTDDMRTLIQPKGTAKLEGWLNKQSRIDFRAEYSDE